MKYFNKFYEVGNNRYYHIVADGELFLATESFINIGKKKLFRKQKTLTQGLKLLKITSPLSILFKELVDRAAVYVDDECPDMNTYEPIDQKHIKNVIKSFYKEALESEKFKLKSYYDIKKEYYRDDSELVKKIAKEYKRDLSIVLKNNPLNYINLVEDNDNTCSIIKAMNKQNLKHLYSEKIDSFAKIVYMYDSDKFGTLTIYKITVVLDTIKGIDTFLYNKELLEKFFEDVYKKDMKEGN